MGCFKDLYKNENELKKDLVFTRIVIFEKCKKYDFERNGLKYWQDKKGNVVRIDDNNSSLNITEFRDILGFKGTTILDAGYVYAPYVPVFTVPEVSYFDVPKKISSRYSKKRINKNFYGTISVQNL